MSTNCGPQPNPTQSGRLLGKSPVNLNQPPSNIAQKNQTEATTRKDIAEVLAENSSPQNSNPQFISYKIKSEKPWLSFKTNNSEKYNLPFTLAELKEAIQTSHDTSAPMKFIMNFWNT